MKKIDEMQRVRCGKKELEGEGAEDDEDDRMEKDKGEGTRGNKEDEMENKTCKIIKKK